MRTPLLQRLANLVQVASSETATDDASSSLSRRAFVSAAAVTAAGVSLAACANDRQLAEVTAPDIAPRAGKSASAERVVIIGAGLAGLTAAYRLKQKGILATVYEANTRLGGRCWTDRTSFADGQTAEHGGEFIDQSHTAIRQLAQELGLVLDNVVAAEPNGSVPFYYFNGAAYTYDQALNDMKAVWQPLKRDYVDAGYPTLYTSSTARGRALDALSVRAWIDLNVPGGSASPLGKLLDIAYCIEYGADTTDQSALNLIYLLGAVGQGQIRVFGPSNEKYKVRGGNDQIVSRLAAALSGQIITGKALSAVTAKGAGWLLDFEDRTSVTADRVILALPFSVLRDRVSLKNAGFPATKLRAIRELGMGQNAKLAMQFSKRHWNTLGNGGDSYADTGYQSTWDVTRGQPGTKGILVDYTGGSASRRQSGGLPSVLAQQCLSQLEPVMPGISAKFTGTVTFDDWPRNPLTLGSYSYYRVGQYQQFSGAEREMVGSCHFAGEHTSQDAQGYLDGAVESGIRAAAEAAAAV
jgi:monoamine oxidase